jgi:IS5 family transposase
LKIIKKILSQNKTAHDKIYSIHEPDVRCIAKGKEAKQYEFGNESVIGITRKTGIVVSAIGFKGNPYDGQI